MYPVQLALFGAEALVMALLVFGAFRNRAQFGRAPLYVVLGGGPCLAAFASWRVEVAPGWAVQPASAVLVGATLAAVLLVYVVEGARQTRTVVHALALGNAGLTLLALIVGQHLRQPRIERPVHLAHAAGAEALAHLVGTNQRAGRNGHDETSLEYRGPFLFPVPCSLFPARLYTGRPCPDPIRSPFSTMNWPP